ncbi:MAG: four helix bundle protein [Candidatus Omnitrophota bacterium]
MGKIERFEDIEAWKLARVLVKTIYEISRAKEFSKDFAFKDQIRRSSISVMANIAEGFERFSKKEFAQFLNVARGSAGELRSHLYVAFDIGYIDKTEFEELRRQCEIISKYIWNFMKYLKNPTE